MENIVKETGPYQADKKERMGVEQKLQREKREQEVSQAEPIADEPQLEEQQHQADARQHPRQKPA